MQIVKINEVKPNPKNPRLIKDDNFKKLVNSIQEFPDMINKRPLIVFTDTDGKYVVLGGNMRLKALKELNYKEVPIILADEWTEEQKAEFLIKDNVGFGEWDWDSLANEWDTERLDEWGLDLPIIMDEPSYEDLIGEEKNKPATMKITFTSPEQLQKAEIEIQELLDRNYLGAYFSVSAGEI
jgi:ParB-like chromosome segregation protein Spo0J